MKNALKRTLAAALSLMLLLPAATFTAFGEEGAKSEDLVILYTNDIHTYIDAAISYDNVAALKKELQQQYEQVLLVDAGDHIQGTAYGAMDQGNTIIDLMNDTGYDAATLGNHEFDYGLEGCLNVISWAKFPYLSCNLYHVADGERTENLLDSYRLFPWGEETVALIGVTTPETISKTTPVYFQDENGNFIYGISGGDDGKALRADLQTAIDSARAEGATLVLALGHLGVDPSSSPWTSEEIIAGVSGLDGFIDGHSHTEMEAKTVSDKDGNPVLLTQTGEHFNHVGMMIVDAETGAITTDLLTVDAETGALSADLYTGDTLPVDEAVTQEKQAWLTDIDAQLGQKIGSLQVTLDNYNENGDRLVRSMETNSGDFSADALYYLFDDMNVDVAVMNSGGIRNEALTGDVSYQTCKDIHPFGNVACLQLVTGQQILDMLEWGARWVGVMESGSFLQVSGLTYAIDTSVPDTTPVDEVDAWAGAPDAYRVYDVQVYDRASDSYQPLDLNREYHLAGYNYILRNQGDGFTMFQGATNVLDYVMEDYMVLANYVAGFENGVIEAENSPLAKQYPGMKLNYEALEGCGRITLTEGRPVTAAPAATFPVVWVVLGVAGVVLIAAVAIVLVKKRKK